jgi:DNA polymerase-3 subunit chi
MPPVRFHFNVPDLPVYACRLLRKACGAQAKVVVCGPENLLVKIDALLWTFSPLDFVAHCRDTASPELREASPVVLQTSLDSCTHHDVLLNLHEHVPSGHEHFSRIIEIVGVDDEARQQARVRWKHYAGAGYAIERHDVAQQDNA